MNSLRIVEGKRVVEYLLDKGYNYLFTMEGRRSSVTAYVFKDELELEKDIESFYDPVL